MLLKSNSMEAEIWFTQSPRFIKSKKQEERFYIPSEVIDNFKNNILPLLWLKVIPEEWIQKWIPKDNISLIKQALIKLSWKMFNSAADPT